MDKNKKIIILAIIIIIIAIIGSVVYLNVSGSDSNKTPFSNKFMAGNFVGTVNEMNSNETWANAYKDPVHHIEYNMSTCKNASFLVDLYKLQGMKGPEEKEYNGQIWSIYTGQGSNQNGNGTSTDKLINVYMCVADKDNQSYVIYIIFNDNTKVNVDGTIYCDGFEEYVEPLLSSLELKSNADAPNLSSLLGIDENTFQQQAFLINQASNGNQTALSMLAGE